MNTCIARPHDPHIQRTMYADHYSHTNNNTIQINTNQNTNVVYTHILIKYNNLVTLKRSYSFYLQQNPQKLIFDG